MKKIKAVFLCIMVLGLCGCTVRQNYEMKITSIDDNGFTINSNYELSYVENNEIDANSTLKEFHIRKDGKTDLAVPMDGLAFKISFEY